MNLGKINLRLTLAIAAFVLLDFGMLAINFSIAQQVNLDTLAVNLAGRQRMLSQRVTKAALLALDTSRTDVQRREAATEAATAYQLFRNTLGAFAEGGEATGGDGRSVFLPPVDDKALLLVKLTQSRIAKWPAVPAADAGSGAELVAFAQFMVAENAEILDAMNLLTSAIEQSSAGKVRKLRMAQLASFVLSLLNFFGILVEMHRARRRAEVQAQTDALTGLNNRAGLYGKLKSALAADDRVAAGLGIVLLDLNGFKAVNDTYGHAAGDETLREVARRLVAWARPGWTSARLGGDEFAVICSGLDAHDLDAACANLSRILSGVPGGGGTVSASVGCAVATQASSADSLMAAADARMYAVKYKTAYVTEYRGSERQAPAA